MAFYPSSSPAPSVETCWGFYILVAAFAFPILYYLGGSSVADLVRQNQAYVHFLSMLINAFTLFQNGD